MRVWVQTGSRLRDLLGFFRIILKTFCSVAEVKTLWKLCQFRRPRTETGNKDSLQASNYSQLFVPDVKNVCMEEWTEVFHRLDTEECSGRTVPFSPLCRQLPTQRVEWNWAFWVLVYHQDFCQAELDGAGCDVWRVWAIMAQDRVITKQAMCVCTGYKVLHGIGSKCLARSAFEMSRSLPGMGSRRCSTAVTTGTTGKRQR